MFQWEVKNKVNVEKAFRKKLKKTESYRRKFNHLGIVIVVDIPMMFFETDFDWKEWLFEINESSVYNYDFVILSHWSGLDLYDFRTREYAQRRIDRNDRDALRKLARMTTEGIIKEDDLVWEIKDNAIL